MKIKTNKTNPKNLNKQVSEKNNTDSTKPTLKYIFCTKDTIICRMFLHFKVLTLVCVVLNVLDVHGNVYLNCSFP